MKEPIWLRPETVISLHAEQLALFGGAAGLRDRGLLESAVARPQNAFAYGTPDLADLAAAYAAGIIGNHPFIDGNKRTGFVAMLVFLGQNGIDFDVPEAEATVAILMLAAGEMAEDGLSRWIRDRMPNS